MRFCPFVLVISLLVLHAVAHGQAPATNDPPPPPRNIPWQFSVTIDAFKAHGTAGYLGAVLNLRDRESDAAGKDEKSLFLDLYTTHLCLIGEYMESRRRNAELMGLDGSHPRHVTLEDGYKPTDAAPHILKASEGRRIVMLNEEHRSSIQRAFMCSLLRGLREQGFTHFAAEAINDGHDAKINADGYPRLESGLYTRDPAFGDMLRLARSLGFTIVGYDGHEQRKPGMSPIESVNSREALQAKNIFERTLAKDPNARVVVYGGRHHIAKAGTGDGWKPMGAVLKELAATDPLAIDLMMMVEGEAAVNQAPAYNDAAAKGWLDGAPIVLVNEKGESLRGPYAPSLDILVFHPRTTLVEGRPQWMTMGGLRKPVRVEVDPATITEPMLLQAFVVGEAEDAVPMDHAVVRPGEPVPALMLRPGSYRVRLVDRRGAERRMPELKVG